MKISRDPISDAPFKMFKQLPTSCFLHEADRSPFNLPVQLFNLAKVNLHLANEIKCIHPLL